MNEPLSNYAEKTQTRSHLEADWSLEYSRHSTEAAGIMCYPIHF